MERDFMGLAVAVKQETPDDEIVDAAPLRSSAMQWSFSNKSCAVPQVLSFQSANEEKRTTGFDALASSGLVTITTAAAFDPNIKSYPQKNTVIMHRPVSSQALAGVAMTNSTASTPIVGTTDLRNSTKMSEAPAQLTIFYNGSVCVYDNISSEKAQAIMLLAGNGPPTTCSLPPPGQASSHIPCVLDGFVVSQPYATTPQRSSPPLPITSISASPLAGGNNDGTNVKPSGILFPSSKKVEAIKIVNPLRSVNATFLCSDTVPQSRRKSLARFLEKRKERAISTAPYAEKQSPDCSIVEAGSTSFSVTSSGSCPVPSVN